MAILTGTLKDKEGNVLHPETEFAKVVDTTDNKTLSEWRSEVDSKTTTAAEKAYLTNAGKANGVALLDSDGKIPISELPDILNKFKGHFANEAALPITGEAGDYAINDETDTVWVWDADEDNSGANPGWSDSGKKGAVVSVNGQTGDVEITLSSLGLTADATTINGLAGRISTLESDVQSAQSFADKVDFAIVENGQGAPANLSDNGMYFEKAASTSA